MLKYIVGLCVDEQKKTVFEEVKEEEMEKTFQEMDEFVNVDLPRIIDEDYLRAKIINKPRKVPTFIKQLRIKPTQIIISYTSKQFQLTEVLTSNTLQARLEYLNLCNIKDLTLLIKPYLIQ